jgi:dTDP-4-amino-4,6-dideoxygalactose transaminase
MLGINGSATSLRAPAVLWGVDPIPMLDLEGQHAPLRGELEAAARRVLASNRFISGDEVAALEHEMAALLGVRRAVGVSSGTDALLALLMAAGVGPGDEVVTTPFSFFATAEAIVRLGARPVFADVEADTLNIDPRAAAARLGPETRAVVVVHLFGRVAQTAPLAAACAAQGIPLIEDAAQAIGAFRRDGAGLVRVGSIGTGAALSFFPSKNLGGFGDGGMVLTNDDALAAQVRVLRNHGASEKMRHQVVGGNFRLDELQAALLRVKLPHLTGWSDRRRFLAALYLRGLAGLPVDLPTPDEGCVWNQFVVRVPTDRRGALVAHLAARGIATAIYYPIPLHLQPALKDLGHRPGDFPLAELAAREVLALPIYPGLTEGAVDRVATTVAEFFR